MKQFTFTAVLFLSFGFAAFAQSDIPPKLPEDPVDNYGKISLNRQKARLEVLFAMLKEDKTFEGLIVFRFTKKESRKHKILHLREIYRFINFEHIEKNRISFAILEDDSETTTLWLIPEGADLPSELKVTNYKLIKAEDFDKEVKKPFV